MSINYLAKKQLIDEIHTSINHFNANGGMKMIPVFCITQFDASGSMTPAAHLVADTYNRLLSMLRSDQALGPYKNFIYMSTMTFATDVTQNSAFLPLMSDKLTAPALHCGGLTNTGEALRAACQQAKNQMAVMKVPRAKICIFVLTDGGYTDPEAVERFLKETEGNRDIIVVPIALGQVDSEKMHRISTCMDKAYIQLDSITTESLMALTNVLTRSMFSVSSRSAQSQALDIREIVETSGSGLRNPEDCRLRVISGAI